MDKELLRVAVERSEYIYPQTSEILLAISFNRFSMAAMNEWEPLLTERDTFPDETREAIKDYLDAENEKLKQLAKASITHPALSLNPSQREVEAMEAVKGHARAKMQFIAVATYYLNERYKPLPDLDKKDNALMEAVKKIVAVGEWREHKTAELVYAILPDLYPAQGWSSETWSKRIGEYVREVSKGNDDTMLQLKRIAPHLKEWPEAMQFIDNQA